MTYSSADANDSFPKSMAECELRFRAAQQELARIQADSRSQLPLSHWMSDSDSHFSVELVARSLRDVLAGDFASLEQTRGVGETRVKRFIVLVERAIRSLLGDLGLAPTTTDEVVPDAGSGAVHYLSPELRIVEARRRLQRLDGGEITRVPLRSLVTSIDRHLPQGLLDHSIEDLLLRMTTEELAQTPGVGPTRLDRLLTVVERTLLQIESNGAGNALTAMVHRSEKPAPVLVTLNATDLSAADAEVTALDWQELSGLIRRHRLDHLTVGYFAGSLGELPATLWEVPLSEVLDRSSIEQLGPVTRRKVASVVVRLGRLLSKLAPAEFSLKPVPHNIRRASVWVESVLLRSETPGQIEFTTELLVPLFDQLETDLSRDIREMIELRVGVNGEPETLEQVAARFDLTRERIRQILMQGTLAISVRWPEGARVVGRLIEWLNSTVSADGVRKLAERVARQLFDSVPTSSKSIDGITEAWQAAGRRKLTPMTAAQILEWSARTFPDVLPTMTFERIQAASPSGQVDENVVWFSNTDTDHILRLLFEWGRPARLGELLLADAVFNECDADYAIVSDDLDAKDERSLWGKVKRDPRIIELDDRQLVPAHHCGFLQYDGVWFVRLEPCITLGIPLQQVPLSQISSLLVNGMLHRGIVDVTAAGAHRFVNESLTQLFGAQLPSTVSPYVLADMLVLDSNGLISAMRRRRLRWDSVNERLDARGKRKWVGFVVAEFGQPLVLSELDVLLRHYYQDYADFVINQIYIAMDEEGESDDRVQFLSNLGHGIPVLVVPTEWQLNADGSNVSEGVQRLASRLRVRLNAGRISLSDLAHVPWLEELVLHDQATISCDETTAFDDDELSGVELEHVTKELRAGVVPEVAEPVRHTARDAEGIRKLHSRADVSRVFALDDDATGEDIIAYVFDRIIQTLPQVTPRSLAELALTADDFEWLKRFFESLPAQEIRRFLASPGPFSDFSPEAQFGAALLLLDAELARRHATGGTLWAGIHRHIELRPGTENLLFVQGQPTARHRTCLEAAARELGLRSAFGEDSAQEWYQLVCLQFGFSRPDVERRLPEWLSGQNPPVSVTRLLHDVRYTSESFQLLWDGLIQYRHGHVGQKELRETLSASPWILPEWIDLLVDRCRAATTSASKTARETTDRPDVDDAGDESNVIASDDAFLSLPQAIWNNGTLRFQCLVESPVSDTTELEDVYDVVAGGQTLSTLLRQSDGTLLAQPQAIELPASNASIEVEMKARSGEVVAVQSVEMWAADDDVDGYVVRSGRRISPWGSDFSKRETLLIYSSDLQIEPPQQQVASVADGGRHVVHLQAGAQVRLLLEGQVLWESQRRESHSWRTQVDVQLEFHPRETPREFRIRVSRPAEIRATAMRYRRKFLELDAISDRQSVSPWLPLERELLKSETVPFTVVLGRGEETADLRFRQRFRLPGQQWRLTDIWETVPSTASCDAGALTDVSFRLSPPEASDDGYQWHVFEGRRWATSVGKKPQRIVDVDGWGAPLTLRPGPYNSVEPDQPVLASVVNHGVLQRIDVMRDRTVRLSLSRRIAPDDRHQLFLLDRFGGILQVPVWTSNSGDADEQDSDSTVSMVASLCSWRSTLDVASTDTGAVWQASLPDEVDTTCIVAAAIAYDGEWLGSRWANDWSRLLNAPVDVGSDSSARCAEDVADAIRWFRLPLMSSDHIESVRGFVRKFAVPVLATWLGCRSDGHLSVAVLDEGWLGVAREMFKDWRPTGDDAIELEARLNRSSSNGSAIPLSSTVSKLCLVHPLLAARAVQSWLNSDEGLRADARHRRVLPIALKKQLLAGATDDQLVFRVAQDVARSPEPPEGTLDFVNDSREGLLAKALKLFENSESHEVTEVDRGNIEVAMRLDAFRTLVLSACLERIGKEFI